ncbi:sugar phosphate isomerase/epimerase [Microbacterium sp. Au-Mic1]|uniref:sugar phosphate isomerase/epimerase family protein n=1 Tax=Microbacterium sp. Au-Mic1 TaxID=2906457 RepID=UPI001E5BC51A|nr:TIM barrel protein [Microbacterium sp. Au-Mic1]MCE4026750.1 sugar phosphate isomerase/epimerase [Microbacterium sp. Au-Mic1]
MLVGVDSTKFPGSDEHGACWMLERAAEHSLDGVYFRSVLELSADLDEDEVRSAAQCAADLGLRLEAGVGKVNPFSTPESPHIRRMGGDYRAAMVRMIEVSAAAGIHELWSALSNYQFRLADKGRFAFDRFRTDVDWPEQLVATERFLQSLAPVLRAHGSHLNIETHEEITTYELVRLVESVGPDVLGITFDSANVAVRGEDPVAAAVRVSPYLRAAHIRDVALVFTDEGLSRFLLPVGEGVLDWPALLAALGPELDVMLSIEGIISSRAEMGIHLFDAHWREGHPDLAPGEVIELVRLARAYEERVARGRAPGLDALRAPAREGDALDFIVRSVRRLRSELSALETTGTHTQ